ATIEGDENKQGVKSQRTVDYSALERTCKSPKGDPRSDIYFLGCVFYQMVTGQLPMEEAESKDPLKKMLVRSFGAIKPIADHPYAPDEELARIIDRMMKIDLKAPYQRRGDVVGERERYRVSFEPVTSEPGGTPVDDSDAELQFESIFTAPIEPPGADEADAKDAGAPHEPAFEVQAL